MEQQQAQPFDTREIRGLSIKMLVAFIGMTITLVGTGINYYNNLVSLIKEVQWEKKSDDQIYRLKIEALETTVKAQGTQIQYLEQRISQNSRKINNE